MQRKATVRRHKTSHFWLGIYIIPLLLMSQPLRAECSSEGRYKADAKGAVLDSKTSLVWQRCAVGQAWKNDTCEGEGRSYPWADAIKKTVEISSVATLSDWRLPTKEELESIVDITCKGGVIDQIAFPNQLETFFWTTSALSEKEAWGISLYTGKSEVAQVGYGGRIRLVSGGWVSDDYLHAVKIVGATLPVSSPAYLIQYRKDFSKARSIEELSSFVAIYSSYDPDGLVKEAKIREGQLKKYQAHKEKT